jgi:hypothetical protein
MALLPFASAPATSAKFVDLSSTQTKTGGLTFASATPATSSTNYSSPILEIVGSVWNSSTSSAQNIGLSIQAVPVSGYPNQAVINFNSVPVFTNQNADSITYNFLGEGAMLLAENHTDSLLGGFGETWNKLQYVMRNENASTKGVIPAGSTYSFFGFDYNGNVGSFNYGSFGNLGFRNLLDDGSGNMSLKGNFVLQNNNSTSIGDSSHYAQYIYGSRLYLNSTAYLDGGTAGQIAMTTAAPTTVISSSTNAQVMKLTNSVVDARLDISSSTTGKGAYLWLLPGGNYASVRGYIGGSGSLLTWEFGNFGNNNGLSLRTATSTSGSGISTEALLLDTNQYANFRSKIIGAASTTSAASLNIPSGTAPTSPSDGDMWYDGTHLYIRIGSTTTTIV